MKRAFDFIVSLACILILLPVFLVIALAVSTGSKGGILFRQQRVGRFRKPFRIYKFRTMYTGSDRGGLLTVGGHDPRITPSGKFLRKYKLDELPQLFNVLKGDMSLVGPRPEVEKYVKLYNPDQLRVLDIRPGITDYASIVYSNENELLGKATDPEQEYISTIMPAKLELNMKYMREMGPVTDLKILWMTLRKIWSAG